MDSILHELRKLPPVSRFFLLGTIGVTVPALLRLVPAPMFVWYWPFVRSKLQIWRFVTPFLLGPMDMQLLFHAYGLYTCVDPLRERV